MKAIIKGKKYDTETAKFIGEENHMQCSWDGAGRSRLYRKRTGEYFFSRDMYVASKGGGLDFETDVICPASYEDAVRWGEEFLSADEYETEFGFASEDNGKTARVAIRCTPEQADMIRRAASDAGKKLNEFCLERLL